MNLCMLALVLMILYLSKATKSNSKGRVKNTATSSGKIYFIVSPKFEPAKNHVVRKLKTTNLRQTNAKQRRVKKADKNQNRHKLKTIAGNWEYYYNAKQDTCIQRKLSPNAIAKFRTFQECLSHSGKSKKFRCWAIKKQGMCKAETTLRACKLYKDKKMFETEKSCIAASNAVHICWHIMKNVCTSVKLEQQCTSFKQKTYYSTKEKCNIAAGKIRKKCWLSEGERKCKPLIIEAGACDSYTEKKLYVSFDACIAASTRHKCFYLNATTQACHGKKMVKPCESLDVVYFKDRQLCEAASKRVQKCFKLSTEGTKCVSIKVIVPCLQKYGLFDTIEACQAHYKFKRCFWMNEKNSKCTMSWRRSVCQKEGPITYFDTMIMCQNAQVSSKKCYKFDKEKSDCLLLSVNIGIDCSNAAGYFLDYNTCKTTSLPKTCYKFDQKNFNCLQMSKEADFDCSSTVHFYNDYNSCKEANRKSIGLEQYTITNSLKQGTISAADTENAVPNLGSEIVTKAPNFITLDMTNYAAAKYYVDPTTNECMPTSIFQHPPIYNDLIACLERGEEYELLWCPVHEFACLSDHKCISLNSVCNGTKECNDGSDESCKNEFSWRRMINKTGQFVCDYGYVACHGEDVCIHNTKTCDGFQDCPSGSDEENCTTS